MKTIGLNRLNILAVPKGEGLSPKQKIVFLSELANLGFRIQNPDLLDRTSDSFLSDYSSLIETLKIKRGGHVDYVPLFKGFPNDIPDDQDYFLKRVFGYLGNVLNLFSDDTKLQNETKVPKWLFDIYEFGADPITQMQTEELFDLAISEDSSKKLDSNIEWIDLNLVYENELSDELTEYLKQLTYSRSSIKEELHKDLESLLQNFGTTEIDTDLIVFKETRALVLRYLWANQEYDQVIRLASSGVDMLRLFASLTETDVSLSDKIKFPKLSRKERKVLLEVLEESKSLVEDLKNYKDLWLEIGRYVHPFEYAKQYPETAKAFDALRNGRIETFASKTEKLMLVGQVNSLLKHLDKKPGVFARKLHEVLRRFPNETDKILRSFGFRIEKLEAKNLLIFRSYFLTINESEYRSVINKRGKMKVVPNNAFAELDDDQVSKIVELLEKGLYAKLQKKESWKEKKAWIDPYLLNYTVPLQQRRASGGIITVGRGSRIRVDFEKVLRLFLYWKESDRRTDLDLSVIQFDENWQYLGHVSYTNLKSRGIVHSGDIQSAPHGAAEFVDISLGALASNVKYLAPQVHKYAGNNFVEMDCHAGWMMRTEVNKDIKTFDIKTVVNKFDLNGIGGYGIPFIVDLESHEVIITDLYVSGRAFHNNVEGSKTEVAVMCAQLANYTATRPTMFELAKFNVAARDAQLVNDKLEADISFGQNECTYNAHSVEKILSELI